jgi:hypothetical protein
MHRTQRVPRVARILVLVGSPFATDDPWARTATTGRIIRVLASRTNNAYMDFLAS